MLAASRRISCRMSYGAPTLLAGILQSAYGRSISTVFREERDTFGPIQVPADRLWSNFFVEFVLASGERE